MRRPRSGITLPVELSRVIDGDTIEVHRLGSNAVYKVRLLDCWCAEMNTEDGRRAKQYAESVLRKAKELYVSIYFDSLDGDLIDVVGKLTTMGRVLGDIWVDDDTTLSQVMVNGFHATKTKQKKGK